MKLKNLIDCWVYELETTKNYGEPIKKWKYKFKKKLNVQQDINELDKNEAGIIDFDKIKIRTDFPVKINKTDGLSLNELIIDKDKYIVGHPEYIVVSNPKIGKTTIYTCERYHGD